MNRLFGTNGIRGVVGRDMTVDLALGVAKAIGSHFKPGPVAIARDTRTSGPMLQDAVVAGLTATGHPVLDGGILPSPALQYLVHTGQFAGGVIVTASHNPPEFNGIKVIDPRGMEVSRSEEEAIEDLFLRGRSTLADWKDVGRVGTDETGAERYVDGILSKIDVTAIRARRFRVVLDCGNGAACGTSPLLLHRLGAEVILLNGVPDGRFPGRPPEPVRENLGALLRQVRESNAHLGVAHDGDADRAIFVDERGEYVFGDRSLALIAGKVVEQKGGLVITPVSSSQCLEDVVRATGGSVRYTKVGAPLVARAMYELGASFGGEENGGMIFPEHQFCRDGGMALAKTLEILAHEGRPLSTLLGALPSYQLHKVSVRYPTEARDAILERLRTLARGNRVDDIDGVKVYVDDGWFLVRPSGTESIFRIFAEAKTEKRAKALAAEGEALLREAMAGPRGAG